jgi:hypothetical protein
MQSEQTQSQQVQQAPQQPEEKDAIMGDKIIQGDEVAGDKIEGDLIEANFENVSGGAFVIGKNIDTGPGAPAGDEAGPAGADPQEGVSVRIDNSVMTGSSIHIQQGRPEKTSQATFDQSKAGSPDLSGLPLTQNEGEIRRLYRILLKLEDSQLFSNDAAEKATLQVQIDQQVQALRSLLPPYLAQARSVAWLIPPDIQAACDRSGVD